MAERQPTRRQNTTIFIAQKFDSEDKFDSKNEEEEQCKLTNLMPHDDSLLGLIRYVTYSWYHFFINVVHRH